MARGSNGLNVRLPAVGELPARVAVAKLDANRNDPKYGPFIRGLEYAQATRFVDELAQRKVIIDLFDRINLQKMSPADSVHIAADQEQKLLDEYYHK